MVNSFDLFFYNFNLSALNVFWLTFSFFSNPKLILLISGISTLTILWKKKYDEKSSYIVDTFLLTVVVMFICGVTKIAFGRARPYLIAEGISGFSYLTTNDHYLSFPSSHVAIAFVISSFYRKAIGFGPMVYVYCLLVMLSRVLLNMHFATDTLVGLGIGAMVTNVYYRFVRNKIEALILSVQQKREL